MASMLETLNYLTQCGIEEVEPFASWDNPKIKNWKISLRILSVGDAIEITKLLANTGALEAVYLNRVYTLAKSIVLINGAPLVTDEDLESYNKDNNLSGSSKMNLFDYKILLLKKLSEPVLNRLAYMYDQLQEKYTRDLLGDQLADTLAQEMTTSSEIQPDDNVSTSTI